MSVQKVFIQPGDLQHDSFALANQVVKSGFRPTYMVALWRGGATIGCYVHELLKYRGVEADHIAVRTSRYTGIGEATESVAIHGMGYLHERLRPGDSVLLVDDVWDSGTTIAALLAEMGAKHPDVTVRVATVYFKPTKNKVVGRKPDFFYRTTEAWLVFPHELEGLTLEEISESMGPKIASIIKGEV